MMWWNQNFFDEDILDLLPTLAVPSPTLITPLPNNISPNKLESNVPNRILRNPSFCFFASLLLFH